MSRLIASMTALFIVFIIFYDMNKGTINEAQAFAKPVSTVETSQKPTFTTLTVKPGATVLSITERLHEKTLPVSIEQIINDFKTLNNGIAPEKIQIGKTYKFPLYE